MTVYKGANKIDKVDIGSTKIGKIYKGSTLLYDSKIPAGTVIFESATAGTYTINITKSQNYYIELVGGGGGGQQIVMMSSIICGGGSGAYVYGTMYLEKGSYTLNIGNAGTNGNNNVAATKGGDTSFNYQIAGGGSRGSSGAGGTYTTSLTGVSGNSGGESRNANSVYDNSATGYGAGGYGYTNRGAVAGYAKIVAA